MKEKKERKKEKNGGNVKQKTKKISANRVLDQRKVKLYIMTLINLRIVLTTCLKAKVQLAGMLYLYMQNEVNTFLLSFSGSFFSL